MINAVHAEQWLARFDALVADLDDGSVGVVQALCGLGRTKLDAVEARALAREITADGDTRAATRIAGRRGARSKRAARAAAKRAKAIAENPNLANDMASGKLSTEQVDTIADAMATDRGAATDQELIDTIAESSVSEGRKAAQDWQTKHTDEDAAKTEHDRQRKLRRAYTYDNRIKGLGAITLEGDNATITELWNLALQRERALRDADGGRDLPAHQHPRTRDQRLFDALVELIRGDADHNGSTSPSRGRPSAVLAVSVEPGAVAHLAGGGPVPQHVVAQALARAGLSVALIDNVSHEPLAWGRLKRNATTNQFLALVVRDQGCVLCDAEWFRCQAHHRMPWHAPGQGLTDLDNLVLVCADCHDHVHVNHLTVIRAANGTWTTRPAAPDEIAPGYGPGPAARNDRRDADPGDRRRRKSGQPPPCANPHGEGSASAPVARASGSAAANPQRQNGTHNPRLLRHSSSRQRVSSATDEPA